MDSEAEGGNVSTGALTRADFDGDNLDTKLARHIPLPFDPLCRSPYT